MVATIEQLAKLEIFSDLDDKILAQLAQGAAVKAYPQGTILICEGERFPAQFHAVLEGCLVAQKIAASGKETTLRQLPAGEMFAAPALFGDGIAPATVQALKDSKIITIDRTTLLNMIQQAPEIALQILHCFNLRLQEMHQTIHGLISERATIRLVRLIQYMAKRYGVEQVSGGARLNIKLPHQQTARMVGITYEECVRIMKKDLSPSISYGRGGIITICDLAALQAMAS